LLCATGSQCGKNPGAASWLHLSITNNDDVKDVIKTGISEFREPIAAQREAGKAIVT
jgi:hypothetical protein